MALEIQQNELGRLMGRGPWGDDVDSFVQELSALLPSLFRELPVAKVEAKATDSNPAPLQLEDFTTSGDVPFVTVTRGPDTFNITINPITGQLTSSAPNQPPARKPTPSVFPGQIAAYLGANLYTVTIFTTGVTNPGTDVTVLQLQGDATVPIPNGSSVMVTKNASEYTMQFPVWA